MMPTLFSTFSVLLSAFALSTAHARGLSTSDHPSISARQQPIPANVSITVFNDTSCGLSHVHTELDIDFHFYGIMSPTSMMTQSYKLSRALTTDERLDWNNPYPPGTSPPGALPVDCGTYFQTNIPDSNNNALHEGTCYAMNGGATVSEISR